MESPFHGTSTEDDLRVSTDDLCRRLVVVAAALGRNVSTGDEPTIAGRATWWWRSDDSRPQLRTAADSVKKMSSSYPTNLRRQS